MRSSAARDGAAANIARQRRFWTRRAASWDHHAANNPGLSRVVDKVIELSCPNPSMRCLDLGCGSGQLTLKLAPHVAHVLGVDISDQMIKLFKANATAAKVSNVDGVASPIEHLAIEDGSLDLVVSNYALHHLRDIDKPLVVKNVAKWLAPGGRLVIGDMMFGRGSSERDRQILADKLVLFAKRGPSGWWRILKNAGRFLFRISERPVSMETWVKMFEQAGLVEVEATPVVNEAAVVRGVRPAA